MKFVIVSGVSGAGKSQAIKCFEDLGFYCVDNLPPVLIPIFVELCFSSQGKIDKAAVVIDIRGGEMFKELAPVLAQLTESKYEFEMLYLDANDETLIKRYKESRRLHPLSHDGKIIDGIIKERELLKDVYQKATHIIDTSNLHTTQLKEEIKSLFVDGDKYEGIMIDVMSFGFKYGIPSDADLVFDVRFLPNPFYIDELKHSTGLNDDVQNYVMGFPQSEKFMTMVTEMIEYLIPYYVEEGKSQIVIAIGCTGGMHRSVTLTERIYSYLKENGHRVIKHHRDIDKDGKR